MKKFLALYSFFISVTAFTQTNNYHDTQGKFEVSDNGQATYTLPIALPPSIQDVGPTINLVYASGQMGGIAGQGWSINSISAISRIATRKDIDGFVDGVDFDDNDKLALDGQRLQLVSGTYWASGSVYKTEVLSNSKIELFISGTIMYFIVTSPDGSRAWYGNYGGTATDLTAFYISRFEDTKGNFITYHYTKPLYKALCINEIKFSANVNGLLTPLNSIKFNYKQAIRAEYAYIKGVKHEKAEILDNIEVKTNNVLFRKYQLTYIVDPQLGYERVSQIQEYNSALEAANPVIFEYDSTTMVAAGSEIKTTYNNNLYFNNIDLSGDFDGDGRLDFIADNGLYRNLFQGSSGQAPIAVSLSGTEKLVATTLTASKLNQFNSVVTINPSENQVELKLYSFNNGSQNLNYSKLINFNNLVKDIQIERDCGYPDPYEYISYYPKKNQYFEGDFNGDGISEVLIIDSVNEVKTTDCFICYDYGTQTHYECNDNTSIDSFKTYLLDLNPNTSTILGSSGFTDLNTIELNYYGQKYIADFNGDGKSDILQVNNDKTYKIFTINQLNQAPWHQIQLIGNGTLDRYSKTKQILFGDYNGDGKTDIMIPDSEGGPNESFWNIYYSNPKPAGGSFFEKERHNIVEYWPNTGTYYSTQTHFSKYYALDTNKDGKSDLVRVWFKYYKPSWTINDHNTQWQITTFANNTGNTQITGVNKFTAEYTSPCESVTVGPSTYQNCNHNSDSPDIVVPVVSNYRFADLNRDIVVVHNHYNKAYYINFTKDVAKDSRITKVTSSGGSIVNEVEYATMEPTISNGGLGNLNEFYSSSNSVNYPFIELNKLPLSYLVKNVKNTVNGLIRYQEFRYHGLQVHLHGLGSIGFKKTARSEWYQNPTAKRVWTVTENRHDWRGAPERVYTQLVNNGSQFSFVNQPTTVVPSGAINAQINTFETGSINGSYKLALLSKYTKDYITTEASKIEYQYDPLYLLPQVVTTSNFTNNPFAPDAVKVTTTTFENNPSGIGANYYIGRLKQVSSTTTAYNDTFTSNEKFTYTNNKLTKTEKKGNLAADSNNYLVEDYVYNPVGNLIKKTISSSGYAAPNAITAPRVVEYTYDATERFVKTSKDIEGLVSTNVAYHPIYGLVTESKNPYDLTTKTTYDNWGKVTKLTDYLNKNVNITYTKANNEYTVTKNGDDGSSSVEISDALGRGIKTGVKLIDGTWSYKSVEYDIKGRKFKESDPYTSTPSLWTVSTFDDYNRLLSTIAPTGLTTTITYSGLTVTANDGTKTTSSTKNANGHVISASDNGGVITFKYFANGTLKESNYAGTIIKMEYDEWGRKTKLDDPSAGIYEYKQNVLGEIYFEKTPNGVTNTKYDDFGKVTEKTIVGLNTNSKEIFTYDSESKLPNYSKFEDFINATFEEHIYTYDSYKRLTKAIETKPLAYFERQTQYDAFGRPEREFYNMVNQTNGKQSNKWFRNTYKNGHHWQILDNDSNHILWQTNAVNARGQLTSANYGNGIGLNQGYDQYGYLQHSRHFNVMVNPVVDIVNLYTTFEPQRGNLTSRTNSLFNWTENFQYDNLDRLTHYTNAKGVQVQQIYESDGRIKENTLGKYNYNSAKKYQNTSIDINSASKAYYENRVGLFNDSMEQQVGWAFYSTNLFSYDNTISKTGTTSLKISNPTTNEAVIHSENWVKIDNAQPTEYTYSAWVKSDGSNPNAEIFLFMKTENETGYFTLVDQKISATSTEWVKIEKTVLVPANIKKLSIRLDNNNTGVLWFDDVQIRKTSEALPTERQLNIAYNVWKSPYEINEAGVDRISFTYNHANNRSAMFYGGTQTDKMQRQYRKYYSVGGSMEIKHNTLTDEVEFVTYVGGDGYTAPVVYKTNGTTGEYLFLHRDYLGSIVAISDITGKVVEKRLFDAWGETLKIVDGQNNILTTFKVLDRGYTGHEHLQSVGLVHMNGRLYDAKLHRFLQPDNFIQDPYNTQNYNRYGYVLNNPLKYNDPSGEELTLLAAVVVGAIISATSYTLTALLADVPFSAGGFIKSAVIGAISGAVSNGIGTYATTINQLGSRIAFQALAHGVSQGVITGIQGGDPIQGFVSGALSSIVSSVWSGGEMKGGDGNWGGLGGSFGQKTIGILAFGTISGGLGATLTKGNFWQGAATGLVVAGLNHAMHKNDKITLTEEELKDISESYLSGNPEDPNYVTRDKVYELIGGEIYEDYLLHAYNESGVLNKNYENTCALRLSYALNKAGFVIPKTTGTANGANSLKYFYKVDYMEVYLNDTYSFSSLAVGSTISSGIIIQKSCGWGNATGHVDILYNGKAGSKFYNECTTNYYSTK